MHTAVGTATQKPGLSSQEGQSSINSSQDAEAGPSSTGFYSAGATNKDYAGPQVAGVSASQKSGNPKSAEGGKTSMFGNRGSLPAKGGSTAP